MTTTAKMLLLAVAVCLSASQAYAQATLTVGNGKVIDLTQVSNNAKGKCCMTAQEIGVGLENGDTTVVRMDNSGGRYYVTNDPKCGNAFSSSAYPTTFSYVYLCGQCKGGNCVKADGGKTIVPAGGSCVTSSGAYDNSKKCIASAPICMSPGSGKCVTFEEANPTSGR